MQDAPSATRLFISYSWSVLEHESWVIQFATDLIDAGIDVILDKWDLKEGHDAYSFMERMVTDKSIRKVVLICDRNYATKADSRIGGVGTEAQIITPELYGSQDQSKFVAVIRERDDDGNPYVPTYYRSRVYIDLSDQDTYAENFERLIRWVYDQPLHKKPEIGKKPDFLAENPNRIHLATAVTFRRAHDGLRNGRDHAVPSLLEYYAAFAHELEKFRIAKKDEIFDDKIIENIEIFIPYRNEIIEIFMAVAMYKDNNETRTITHRFFEKLISYMEPPEGVHSWGSWDFDNFKFVIHEMVLYYVAILIKNERFDAVAEFIGAEFFVNRSQVYGQNSMVPFIVFSQSPESLDARNTRLQLHRLSLHADILKERCRGLGVGFEDLMVADFILFMRSKVDKLERGRWWPETLVYVGRFASGFAVFARCKSSTYFNKVKKVLGVNDKEELESVLKKMENSDYEIPRWQFNSFNPRVLLGFEGIGTRP